jgi:hypothetical protein
LGSYRRPFLQPVKLAEYIFLKADCLQSLKPYSSSIRLPTQHSELEETRIVTIYQGGAIEAAIDGANETIDSFTKIALDLVADWCPEGEMAVEQ